MGLLVSMNRYWSTRDYCSKGHVLLPPALSIEQGIASIERILQRDLICIHDAKELNHIYHKIDEFERRADQLPDRGSQYVLQLIIEKVQVVFSEQEIGTKNLIFLYQMQNFTEMGESIKKCFEKKSEQFSRSFSQIEELANHLPCCVSSEHFERDLTTLLGSGDRDERTTRILNKKRRKLESHVEKKEKIEKRKLELIEKRAGNPNQFPSYLDELLEYGHVRLFDHLLEMRAHATGSEREKKIEAITVSDLSHIVLETREALIRKVESSIPEGYNNFLFLLGGTRAGKSTTLSFLRGDKMRFTKDSTYESLENHGSIIGHDGTTSCTFLPNIEVKDNLILVDFPGFSDTNGMLIALGAEFALKALIAKYNPKILVLESITNINDGYKAVKVLRERLDRILGNKENCLLGITKYSKNDAFIKIQEIEKQQREELFKPSSRELELIGSIKMLTEMGMLDHPKAIEAKKELAELQQKREQQQLKDLPETVEKTGYRLRVQEIESELLKETGLGGVVELSDLEDPNCLRSCLEAIAKQEQGALPPLEQTLSSEDKVFIEKRLSKDLKEKIKKEESYRDEFDSVKDFEQCVHDFSFVKSVFSHTHPEIGEFFHLPENDSRLVHEFDKQIVGDCIDAYMTYIVSQIDIEQTRAVIDGLRPIVSDEKINKVEEKLNGVQKYIFGLLGVESKGEKEADAKWKEIQKQTKQAVQQLKDDIERELGWKGLTKFLACVPLGIPFGIHRYTVNQEKREQIKSFTQESANKYIDEEYQSLEQTHDSLIKLKGIEKIIKTQDEISKIYKSVPLTLNSMEELAEGFARRINKVRALYGESDWDVRVTFLADKLRKNFADIKGKYIPFFGDICIPSLLLHIEQDPKVDFIQMDSEDPDIQDKLFEIGKEKGCLSIRQKTRCFLLKRSDALEKKINASAFGIDENAEMVLMRIGKWNDLVVRNRGSIAAKTAVCVYVDIAISDSIAFRDTAKHAFRVATADAAADAAAAGFQAAKAAEAVAEAADIAGFRAANGGDAADAFRDAANAFRNAAGAFGNAANAPDADSFLHAAGAIGAIHGIVFTLPLQDIVAEKEDVLLARYLIDNGINPLEWIEKYPSEKKLDRKFRVRKQLRNSKLDEKIIDQLLKLEQLVITNTQSTCSPESLGLFVQSDQEDINDLWRSFFSLIHEIGMDIHTPATKALLAAAILQEFPLSGNKYAQ